MGEEGYLYAILIKSKQSLITYLFGVDQHSYSRAHVNLTKYVTVSTSQYHSQPINSLFQVKEFIALRNLLNTGYKK